ncbi:MAG: hypothetical protein DHS20C16_22630 [Phycisphaerae bacterium]|nr:MAG: hypothetical protein DHS20C16_22630 [Phycisphaerae bacterium]
MRQKNSRKLAIGAVGLVWVFSLSFAICGNAVADNYDDNDFLIAGAFSDNIFVYDAEDYSFKTELFTSNFDRVRAIGFDLLGNVASANLGGKMHLWSPDGTLLLTIDVGLPEGPVGVGVGPSGNYFIAVQSGILEFDQSGNWLRTLGPGKDYKAVAFLPGDVMWGAGGGSSGAAGIMDVYDVVSGSILYSIPFDNGQLQVQALHYSPSTHSVLIADNTFGAVFERDESGAFIRRFDAPGIQKLSGVTRGPGGVVFATDNGGSEFTDGILHIWNPDGTHIESVTLANNIRGAANILWTGDLPTDCNSNGTNDALEIAGGTSIDCNHNQVPDGCDVELGDSPDCDSNGIPNDCVVCSVAGDCDDCDEETVDICFQGVCLHQPDCLLRHPADFDADGDVDLADYSIFAECFGGPDGAIPTSCPFVFP